MPAKTEKFSKSSKGVWFNIRSFWNLAFGIDNCSINVPESDVATVVKGVATLTSKNWHSCTKSHLNSHYQSLSVTFNHSIGRSIDRSKTETGVPWLNFKKIISFIPAQWNIWRENLRSCCSFLHQFVLLGCSSDISVMAMNLKSQLCSKCSKNRKWSHFQKLFCSPQIHFFSSTLWKK